MNSNSVCLSCGNCTVHGFNYCNWECHIDHAKALGGKEVLPNGEPVMCIKANGDMLECGEGDHPTYMFPVNVKYIGTDESLFTWGHADGTLEAMSDEDRENMANERHALIYTDGNVALTLYEASYYLLHIDGTMLTNAGYHVGKDWVLDEASVRKIKERSLASCA